MRVVTLNGTSFAAACRALGAQVAASGYSPDALVGIASGGLHLLPHLRIALSTSPETVTSQAASSESPLSEADSSASSGSNSPLSIYSITCRRPTTAAKQAPGFAARLIRRILPRLPRPLADFLRIIEACALALSDRLRRHAPPASGPLVPWSCARGFSPRLPEDTSGIPKSDFTPRFPEDEHFPESTIPVNPLEIAGSAPARILVVDDAVDSGATLRTVIATIRSTWPDAEIRSAVLTVTRSRPLILPDYTLYPRGTLLRFPWSLDAAQNKTCKSAEQEQSKKAEQSEAPR